MLQEWKIRVDGRIKVVQRAQLSAYNAITIACGIKSTWTD